MKWKTWFWAPREWCASHAVLGPVVVAIFMTALYASIALVTGDTKSVGVALAVGSVGGVAMGGLAAWIFWRERRSTHADS